MIVFFIFTFVKIIFSDEIKYSPVKQKTAYVSYGAGFPFLSISCGYRFQTDSYGWDFPIELYKFDSFLYNTQVKVSAILHYYPQVSLGSNWYFGGGVGPGILLKEPYSYLDALSLVNPCKRSYLVISPTLVIGKKYQTEDNKIRFFEAKVTLYKDRPTGMINWGLGF